MVHRATAIINVGRVGGERELCLAVRVGGAGGGVVVVGGFCGLWTIFDFRLSVAHVAVLSARP